MDVEVEQVGRQLWVAVLPGLDYLHQDVATGAAYLELVLALGFEIAEL